MAENTFLNNYPFSAMADERKKRQTIFSFAEDEGLR